jgi:ribosomal protein L16 Arg81 hydroxylase
VSDTGRIFNALIAPIAASEFFSCYWEKQSLHVRREEQDFYRDVLRPEDVEHFLSRNDIRYPALRMAKDGPTIRPEAYSSILKFGAYASEGLVNVDDVGRLHAGGATIVLQMTRSSIPRLGYFANELQLDLQCNVETTVYATPANSQGFTTHYDTHSVLVLQIAGKKRWRLYDVLFELPTLEQSFDKCQKTPGPVRSEVVLEPGDLLYVPRGVAHDALAEGELSLHVTVGLFPPTYLDLLGELVDELKDDVRYRRSPLNQILAGDADAVKDEASKLLSAARSKFHAERLRTKYAQGSMAKLTQDNNGRLFDTLHVIDVTLQTLVARRRQIICMRTRTAERINLSFYGKTVSFPDSVAPAIDCIFEREQFPIRELQVNLSDQSKLNIVRRLIKEGLLRIQSLG